MIKKTLAIPRKRLVLEASFFSQLQGHCFGFSLCCLLQLQYPEHPILTQDVVADSQSLQRRYDENKENDGAIIDLPGLIERQSQVFSTAIRTIASQWSMADFPEGLLERGPCVFYFALEGGDEGHAVYLDPGDLNRDAVICDTHDPALHETLSVHVVQAVMIQKIMAYVSEKSPELLSGNLLLQTICYEKVVG